MDITVLLIIFIAGLLMAIIGFYAKGYHQGKKDTLKDLFIENKISSEDYKKLLK